MKRDAALGIALILTGSLGLVSQNFQTAIRLVPAKQVAMQQPETKAKPAIYKYRVDSPTMTAAVCDRNLTNASRKTTLLEKLSVALTDLDTMVSLQRL